jgi:manganese/zinc/iron transport system permease protein
MMVRLLVLLTLLVTGVLTSPTIAHAAGPNSASGFEWPTGEQFLRVVLLRDYNTRVVLFGTTLLGVSSGLVGVFLLLRRRSLMADVISHTTFPGIALAFLIVEVMSPGNGKSTPALLTGAFIFGLVGMACTTAIVRYTRIKEDAALAIVLSVFFGLGIALFTVVQSAKRTHRQCRGTVPFHLWQGGVDGGGRCLAHRLGIPGSGFHLRVAVQGMDGRKF